MLIPTFMLGAGMLGRAPEYEGDVRKEMTCLTCDGLGRTGKEKEACSTCRGRGVAEFIVPGPNRPIQVVGTVTNAENKPVPEAEVGIREPGTDEDQLRYRTNPSGQFGVKLPPGKWEILVQAEGQGTAQKTLEVVALNQPIPARGTDTFHKLEVDFPLAR